MKQRIITALVLAPLAIAAIFFLPLKFFMLLVGAIFLLASKEWGSFVSKGSSSSALYLFGAVLGATLFFIPAELVWQGQEVNAALRGGLVAAACWWLIALLLVVTYPRSASSWSKRAPIKALFGLLTLVPFFWALVVLRAANIETHFYYGAQLVMYVFLLVWAADSGAYFAGKRFGKHKLAPKVSPGKTIEGFAGGLLSAMLIAALATYYFEISQDKLALFITASLVTSLGSALGDLTESIFKREAGLKDSGNLLPGHGGILDRIDSLTAALPIFTLFYILVLV